MRLQLRWHLPIIILNWILRTVQKWLFRNLGGRKWMKLSGEQGSKLF
ncbi:TPA: hypothetical protein HH820_005113 [Escherichia coli]|nr:hypothetical protein [Escherichia coli]